MKLRFCIIFCLLCSLISFSQKKDSFSFKFNKTPLSIVLITIENNFDIRLSYRDKIIQDKSVTTKKNNFTLKELFALIEEQQQIKFQKISDANYIIIESRFQLNKVQNLDNVLLYNYLTNGIYKNKNGSFQIKINKLAILPGLLEADVIESIQQLPGVTSPNETATGLIVRGGANDQNRVIFDGINSYHSGHLFGMISPYNPNMAKKVTFYNKGTNAKYGERISSVTNIETSEKISKDIHASFDINGINVSAYIEAPIISDKFSFKMASRRSYTEFFETFTFKEIAKKVFQNTKISNPENTTNDFFFSDYNIKLNYNANKKNQFYFSTFNIVNNLDYLVKNTNNNQTLNDLLNIKNDGYSLKWNKKWNDKINQTTLASFSNYTFKYNLITRQDFNFVSDFEKRNTIFDTSINSEISINIKNNNNLNIGYQYNFKDVSYAFLDTSNVTLILDSDQNKVSTHAIYSHFSYYNDNFFDIECGFRINYFSTLNKVKLEPRLIIHKAVLENIKIQLTGEVKNQTINQIDETILSDLSLENKIWRLADNKNYPIINSNQISAGIIYKNKGWSFDLDFYKKNTKGLTALSLGFLNPTDNQIHLGSQKINGIDFYIKKDFNALKTWFNYAYSDVKNKFNNINSSQYFTANTAITHNAALSFSYKLKQFNFALGFKVHSGKPYTKAIILDDDSIVFDKINTENLKTYHRLDLSSTYKFTLNKNNKVTGKIGFSIKNIYNQNNQISREHAGNNSINDPVKIIDKFSLGFTPNFLFKVYW